MTENIYSKLNPGWEIVRKLGEGSFGSVYEIQHDNFGYVEKAALKVIQIPRTQSEIDELYSSGYDRNSITEHFRGCLADIAREYSLMAEMKGHTNVVYCDEIKYIQHDDGIGWDIFIKMELLTPMTKVFSGNVREEDVIRLGTDLCKALVLCREKNIIHRDIKPQNIFVSERGDFKLGDFGVAKVAEKTTGGTKTGTYNYMAPEVYNNQPYGSSADIYSLGLVMYWMLNEKCLPFYPMPPQIPRSGDVENALYCRFGGQPIPPPLHGSEWLKSVVLKACAYDPRYRYHSAEEMLNDLCGISKEVTVKVRETEEERRSFPAWCRMAVCGVLALAVIVLSVALFPRRERTAVSPTPTQTVATARPSETSPAGNGLPSNVSPTPQSSSTPAPADKELSTPIPAAVRRPSSADLDALGDDITYPDAKSYLDSYETMYVKTEKGSSAYVYWDSSGQWEHRRNRYVYEMDEVTVLARENGFSCILCTNREGQTFSGWVGSSLLVYEY